MEHITLTTPDNFSLDASYGKGTNNIGIVFMHGLRWYKEGEEPFVIAAEKLTEKGFSTLLFDFRGHGKSSGESAKDFSITSQVNDIEAAVQFLKDHGVTTIYLAGASFGAGATVLYTISHPEITKLVLSNPSMDYQRTIAKYFTPQLSHLEQHGYIEAGSRKFKFGKKFYEELQQYNPTKELEKYPHDLLIIHGDNDSRIPYQKIVELFEKLENPHKKFSLVLGADHGFHTEPFSSQVAESIVSFFMS